ncbi:MAG: ImmA/IrrE family metallo-endopeptidase [Albidovulum sp.]|nr:ImmA/IrrE family metallo-endopeptidase [Albidovulum sp.]
MDRKSIEMAASETWKIKSPSREFLNLPKDERDVIDEFLGECPVRLGAMAARLGIKVLISTLPRGTSGRIEQEGDQFVIRINRHEAKHRQRFTLAHEIAHYLLHRDKIVASGGWSENVLLRSGQPQNIEYEANRLASDLVIPSNLLANATTEIEGPITSETIKSFARRFGVSEAAMEIKFQMM